MKITKIFCIIKYENTFQISSVLFVLSYREKADVVFLQEVVADSFVLLEEKLPQYRFIPSFKNRYFCIMLLSKASVSFDAAKIFLFEGSRMSRNLLLVDVSTKIVALQTLTTSSQYKIIR